MSRFRQKGLPWASGIGTKVNDCISSNEVMKKAKLDWIVNKCNLVAQMPFMLGRDAITEIDELNGTFIRNGFVYRDLQDAYATYRTDKNIPLGLVKSKYEVVQNMDAFTFFDEAIGPDKCEWESAGCLGYGHKIFVTAKLKLSTDITLNNGVKDTIDNYLVFTNSHDGTSSLTIMFTPIRVFCTNCLNSAFNKNDSYIRIRHTESAKDKLHKGAEILHIACEKAREAKDIYNALYTINMKDEEVLEYLTNLNLTEKEREALLNYDPKFGYKKLLEHNYMTLEATNISVRKANTIQNMFEYYMEGIGQEEIQGTAWGAYNAVTGYYSNIANLEGSKRFESLLYGNAQNITQKGIVSAYDFAKSA